MMCVCSCRWVRTCLPAIRIPKNPYKSHKRCTILLLYPVELSAHTERRRGLEPLTCRLSLFVSLSCWVRVIAFVHPYRVTANNDSRRAAGVREKNHFCEHQGESHAQNRQRELYPVAYARWAFTQLQNAAGLADVVYGNCLPPQPTTRSSQCPHRLRSNRNKARVCGNGVSR